MRKMTADFILSPEGTLLENYTLIVDAKEVVDLVSGSYADSEKFEGILSPGFINTHCHLELSHLKNKISEHTGLHGFIKEFVNIRNSNNEDPVTYVKKADTEMWNNGIQGVGDICNVAISFPVKKQSEIRYHNFIELFTMIPEKVVDTFSNGEALFKESQSQKLSASIVPHAPYSVPETLHTLIVSHHNNPHSLWCIHNQETKSENEMFQSGTGKLADCFKEMGINRTWFSPSQKNSIQTLQPHLPANAHLLFVHNTFTSQSDIDFLISTKSINRSWFSLCVKANLYIENHLPDIPMLMRNGCMLTIGTDSLASNDTLSVLEELKTIQTAYPEIETGTLLHWATFNGAAYFNWNDLGSFKPGTSPGVIQLTHCDTNAIGKDAVVKRII